MDRTEKILYHQIHPLKLAVDWITAFASLWFFWRHDWIVGLLILFVPSVIVTVLLVTHANLEWLRQSAFGLYMTPRCS
jgi:hypothetical protein